MCASVSGKTTFEGPVGRVVGAVWGSIWLGVGVLLLPILLVRGGLLPAGLERTVVGLTPWVSGAASGILSTGGMAVGGLFMALCLGYGCYHLGRVLLVSDYSITLGSRTGGP